MCKFYFTGLPSWRLLPFLLLQRIWVLIGVSNCIFIPRFSCMPPPKAEDLAIALRAVVLKDNFLPIFIDEEVKKAKQLQRKNFEEYESTRLVFLNVLNYFNPPSTTKDFLCLLTALSILLRLEPTRDQISQFNHFLYLCVKNVNTIDMIYFATDVFSAALDSVVPKDFVIFYVQTALLWLQNPSLDMRHVSGTLILSEIAKKKPDLISVSLANIFECLWNLLASENSDVQRGAISLFSICCKRLAKLPYRSRYTRKDIYKSLETQLSLYISDKSISKNIAGLLAFQHLVSSIPSNLGQNYLTFSQLLVPFFTEDIARNTDVFAELFLRSLLALCHFNKNKFITTELDKTVKFAWESITIPSRRKNAFFVLSEIISRVGLAFQPYAETTCQKIRDTFKSANTSCWEALECFSVICQICPPSNLPAYLEACVHHVFRWRLSAQLIKSLQSILNTAGPTYQTKLEEELLDKISFTLSGYSFKQATSFSQWIKKNLNVNDGEVGLALTALNEFSFSRSDEMAYFLRDYVLPFIENGSHTVRNSAVIAIVKLLLPPSMDAYSIARKHCIDFVVDRMIFIGVAHEDPEVRRTIIGNFTPSFYPILSDRIYFDRLRSIVDDEFIDCRLEAIKLLCNMINFEPIFILPVIRKVLCVNLHAINLDCSTEIQLSHCFRTLTILCIHAPQYIIHFNEGIVQLLLPRLKSISSSGSLLVPLLSTYIAFVNAQSNFGSGEYTFREEIPAVLNLLSSIQSDRGFQSRSLRILCFRFLSAALVPLIDNQSPYQLYPDLFRHISLVIHNSDEESILRLEALKCLGKIGALDVTSFQAFEAQSRDPLARVDLPPTLSSPSQQECANAVLCAISAIIDCNEPRYNGGGVFIRLVVETIVNIGEQCPSSHSELHVVVAPLARSMMLLKGRLLATILKVYCSILRKAGYAAHKDIGTIFHLFSYVWQTEKRYQFLAIQMLSNLTSFSEAIDSSRVRGFRLIPLILNSLSSPDTSSTQCFAIIGLLMRNIDPLEPLCDSLVESLLCSMDNIESRPVNYFFAAIKALRVIVLKLRVHNVAASIVRHLLRSLHFPVFRSDPLLCDEVIEVFISLFELLREEFNQYADTILDELSEINVGYEKFSSAYKRFFFAPTNLNTHHSRDSTQEIVNSLLQICDEMVSRESLAETSTWSNNFITDSDREEKVLLVHDIKLRDELAELVQRQGEFGKWANRFCMIVLEESPYKIFRCVSASNGLDSSSLAVECPAFSREIVQIAFRTLWAYSSAVLRNGFLEFLKNTFQVARETVLPDEVVTLLLSIVEYMDRAGEPLGISNELLADCALNRGMVAKAVYWSEGAYRENSSEVESLTALYSELHMMQSSLGIFNLVSANCDPQILMSSLIKLGRYEEALEMARKDIENYQNHDEGSVDNRLLKPSQTSRHTKSICSNGATSDSENQLIKTNPIVQATTQLMLCLDNIGDYDAVVSKWGEVYNKPHTEGKKSDRETTLTQISEYAADACIRLQKWALLDEIIEYMPRNTIPFCITKAVRYINLAKYSEAFACITDGRKLLLDVLTNIHESYARSYNAIMMAQQLTELEEIAAAYIFQQKFHSSKPVSHLTTLFKNRIQMMVPSVRSWKNVLGLHGLLIHPTRDVKTRIQFIQLCRQEKAKQEEKFALSQLMGHRNISYDEFLKKTPNPQVVMEYIEYAVNSKIICAGEEKEIINKMIDTYSKPENESIIARAYARLGCFSDLREALECYRSATLHNPKWHIAWRKWAEVNAEIINDEYSDEALTNAIDGYIQSILLGTTEVALIQDVLKLMVLWLIHGDQPSRLKELRRRVFDIPTRVWHLVVPQLVAHMDSGTDSSCELVAEILTNVALDYPNTLLFPLNLCRTSISEDKTKTDRRKCFAIAIVKKMEEKYPVLILQGKIVIEELNRLGCLLHERVFDNLEEAATQYFHRKNTEEMLRSLQTLHAGIPKTPQSIEESQFIAEYSRTLSEAEDWIQNYVQNGDEVSIQSAWNIYHAVYRKIRHRLENTRQLSMQFYSPKLFEAHALDFALPDENMLRGCTTSKILRFNPQMTVIASKQRPKKISLTTIEGKNQKFLLKSREDLRLDERVMQLFTLVNVLLISDSRSSKNLGFQIQQYTVTPLRETVGLIGWVDGCHTMHELVREYRTRRDVQPGLEHLLMCQIIAYESPKSYDNLSVMSKIEVIEFLADHTSGHDIRKAMWAMAPSCEVWIDQRREYMTSLANMSMVGYILGLGDRHPNNIMLQKSTGHIVHIDFGDCFEVTMTREKFPEKVPFRLTRMLRNAMDISGIDGSFRWFSETSMSVLRKGSHSVLALMQAFIQDPLISWRLVALPGKNPQDSHEDYDRNDEKKLMDEKSGESESAEASPNLSAKAIESKKGKADYNSPGVMVERIKSKLEGKDFTVGDEFRSNFDVTGQVSLLIEEATDIMNVSQLWSGWCPFW